MGKVYLIMVMLEKKDSCIAYFPRKCDEIDSMSVEERRIMLRVTKEKGKGNSVFFMLMWKTRGHANKYLSYLGDCGHPDIVIYMVQCQ